jgi:hypothetical protein
MDKFIRKGIVKILRRNKKLLRIPIRQKAKFEGWLKFELAHYLEQEGMENVEVESTPYFSRDRTDITFFNNETPHSIELKTPNANWKINGVSNNGRPITKNINSIIDDTFKLNSENGIVAFVLFPIPLKDNRWEAYIDKIRNKTGLNVSKEANCELVSINIDENNKCSLGNG